ncbi:LysR family transcriptional regulator [Streptomyces decoyicus]|uniref:LysR family transcriptional regulator n=1 Tax=Streptomyces decoyicus TaxID=249567 RepID=UPI0033B6C305
MTGVHLDLNLLTALDALLEEGSVSRAADRLHVTSPAMSRSLGRLRRAMNDPILVRTGRTMTPTARALAIREQVHALVEQVHTVLAPERDIDLLSLERTFTVVCHDAIANTMGPLLLTALRAQAPGVRLRMLGEASTDTNDLRYGHVDLEISAQSAASPDICQETVAHDRLVVVARHNHPLTAGGLTVDAYVAAEHLTVSRRGRLTDPIDELLHIKGRQRHVVASAPTSAAALHFIRHSDVITAVPESLTETLAAALDLHMMPFPFRFPTIPVTQAWHRRYESDRAHAWLRSEVRRILQDICSGAGTTEP